MDLPREAAAVDGKAQAPEAAANTEAAESTPSPSCTATALVVRKDLSEWQSLWLASQARPWRTLALVPGDQGVSTIELAGLLMMVGREHGETVEVADLRDVPLSRVRALLAIVQARVDDGERVVLATSALADNMATIPITRSADGALLCAALGQSSVASIRNTVERIGRDRFFGSVLLRGSERGAR